MSYRTIAKQVDYFSTIMFTHLETCLVADLSKMRKMGSKESKIENKISRINKNNKGVSHPILSDKSRSERYYSSASMS